LRSASRKSIGTPCFLKKVGESFVRQFPQRRHPIASELLELVERILVKGDQCAQLPNLARLPSAISVATIGSAEEQPRRVVGYRRKENRMTRKPLAIALTAFALLASPAISFAQGGGGGGGGSSGGGASAGGAASGPSAGSNSAVGSPNAGSVGAGSMGTSGIAPGPANVGGLNNSGNDPSGAGNASKLNTPPGTNTAGTAQSTGSGPTGSGANSGAGVTTGSARSGGSTVTGPQTKEDAAIDEETKKVDQKVKSICRGC
jgi:hypothetical protein